MCPGSSSDDPVLERDTAWQPSSKFGAAVRSTAYDLGVAGAVDPEKIGFRHQMTFLAFLVLGDLDAPGSTRRC